MVPVARRLDLLTQEIESITGQKITVDGHLNVERTTTEKLQDEMQRFGLGLGLEYRGLW